MTSNKMKSSLILSLFLSLFSFSVMSASPPVLVEDLQGKQHSLNEYIGQGQWVIVNVWATNCPYCRAEIDTLNAFHNKYKDSSAIVIGLTVHWPSFGFPKKDNLTRFAEDYFIDYPLLLADAELAGKFIGKPVNMIPLTFFYNPAGELVHQVNGVVTSEILQAVTARSDSDYNVMWADEVPPVFQKK